MNDKEKIAIERIKLASAMSWQEYSNPLIITYSGGKDSAVLLYLAQASGIPFEVQHNFTTADAPETVYHIRSTFAELEEKGIKCSINYPIYKGEIVSMWTLIPKKLIPPTRMMRYCCDILKEQGGKNRFIATGVRWEESSKRKNRAVYEKPHRKKEKRILINDNSDARMLFENCRLKAKRVCNPIIDWTDNDVWDYINSEKIKTNVLYQCGFQRVGCIGCPLAKKENRIFEFEKYPIYKKNYICAFDKMLLEREKARKGTKWKTGEEVFFWWIEEYFPNQIALTL